jgi:hypothetical protein
MNRMKHITEYIQWEKLSFLMLNANVTYIVVYIVTIGLKVLMPMCCI